MEICCSKCREQFPQHDSPECRYCFDGACKKKRDTLLSIDSGLEEHGELITIDSGMEEYSQAHTGLAIREGVGIIQDGGEAGQPKGVTKYVKVTEPCPPDYSQRGSSGPNYGDTVYWSLNSDKANNFWADLATTTGLTSEKYVQRNSFSLINSRLSRESSTHKN